MAGEFKGLNILNQDSIEICMETYLLTNFKDSSMGEIKKMSGSQARYNFMVDQEELFLDFYFNGNGKTTIQPYNGKQRELKIEMAKYLKKELASSVSSNSTLSVRDISKEDFESFMELVSILDSVESINTNGNCYKISGVQKDSATITYYPNGTILLQGAPLRAFNEITTLLSELFLESNEILQVYNSTYKMSVDKDKVTDNFNALMPNSKNKLPKKLEIVIKQSIYNTYIEGEMFDYTFLIFPALRALEGHIKYIAKDKRLTIGQNVGSLFDCDPNTKVHYLRQAGSVSVDVKNHLEKQYICYKDQRNVYLHWDELITQQDTTQLVGSKESAKQKIFDILKEIDYYYTIC